ncbi:hypothetical protein AS594_06995 [Streptomyces agglomeratus]|uniref:Uncharacterized protein n=1 Tax=Streptomyces agglomeratus TaxID=285458 RepID=A0A1E5P3Y9_9ACTN|nr:hypothetical protein [Streptomyces agglomeratus]OEJ24268.1 hypothetical protein AS594_06995 [Streptomyces agglomeratus]
MTGIDYAARVAKGAALLDEKKPGWERLLDLSILDIESGTCCVTAQLSGADDWRTGMNQVGLSLSTYTDHGFRADDDYQDDYPTLNVLWRDLITERLSPGGCGTHPDCNTPGGTCACGTG